MKRILILTGPQGSGNHLWSKIFALHPRVAGWRALLDTYWIGHDQEPFAECWQHPERLVNYSWSRSDFFVTSVSVPYMNNGEVTMPDFRGFVRECQGMGHRVQFAVLGRDQNIVRMQQERVRGAPTLSTALEQFRDLAAPAFLSYELLHLYREQYLSQLQRQLEWPIDINNPRIKEILAEDTNSKYFAPVAHHATDDLAKQASRKWK